MASSTQPSSEASARPSYQSVLFGILLQQHRSIIANLLVVTTLSRVLAVCVVLYVSLIPDLRLTHVIAASLAAALLAAVWMSERSRWTTQLAGLERSIAERAPDEVEDLYIASRYFLRYRPQSVGLLSRLEPYLWALVTLCVLGTNVAVSGLSS